MPPGSDASGRLMPTLASTAVIAPASEPIIRATRPKNQAAEVGQNETAKSTPKSSAPQMPIASTRFCIPSVIIAPPPLIVISPTRNMPEQQEDRAENQVHVLLKKQGDGGNRHRRGRQKDGQRQVEQAAPQRVEQPGGDHRARIADLAADIGDRRDVGRQRAGANRREQAQIEGRPGVEQIGNHVIPPSSILETRSVLRRRRARTWQPQLVQPDCPRAYFW